MKFKIHQVTEEGLYLKGDESPSLLEFTEPLFRFEQPIHYELEATWVGECDLLIRGKLSTVIRAQCVRTLEWFDLPLVVEDFQSIREGFKGDEVDLTQEIREDILILLPTHPVSPQAKPIEVDQAVKPEGSKEVWKKLDQLKLK